MTASKALRICMSQEFCDCVTSWLPAVCQNQAIRLQLGLLREWQGRARSPLYVASAASKGGPIGGL